MTAIRLQDSSSTRLKIVAAVRRPREETVYRKAQTGEIPVELKVGPR